MQPKFVCWKRGIPGKAAFAIEHRALEGAEFGIGEVDREYCECRCGQRAGVHALRGIMNRTVWMLG